MFRKRKEPDVIKSQEMIMESVESNRFRPSKFSIESTILEEKKS